MSHYAYVRDGRVVDVIRADEAFINHLSQVGHPLYPAGTGTWVQTSYNTQGGQHLQGGTPLRKNFAGIGYIYDAQRDAFIPPRPYDTWVLNEDTCLWEPPFPPPDDGKMYEWDPWTNNYKEFLLPESMTPDQDA